MSNYNPDSFASIMHTIYDEQVSRYRQAGIEPHPRVYQDHVKLRAKIHTVYRSSNSPIQEIAEGVLLALRDGILIEDILAMDENALLELAQA